MGWPILPGQAAGLERTGGRFQRNAHNAQAGFGRKDDRPPATWFEPVTRRGKELRFKDYFRSKELTPADIDGFLDDYYQERGWDPETGTPTPQRLAELGVMEIRRKP
jgi:aldehyde:ferredoxin oxidoreductase